LNCRGQRVDFKETQGLLSKNARADRYAAGSNGSGPLDRDRAIQSEVVRRSNLVRRFWIRWLRTIGRAGGGGVVAGDHLRGSASPECAILSALGWDSSGDWVREDQRNTRDAPGPEAGLGKALGCARHGGGGSVQRASPACEHSRCSGSERVQTVAVCVRGAKASQNRSRALVCWAVGGPPRRSRGVCRRRPVFWPRGCVLDHDSQSKRKGRSGRCSPSA